MDFIRLAKTEVVSTLIAIQVLLQSRYAVIPIQVSCSTELEWQAAGSNVSAF